MTSPECAEDAWIQSKTADGSVVCPSCGCCDAVTLWNVLEADCNPEYAQCLGRGELLLHRCSSCGTLFPLDYPLFYIDRTRHRAVFYPAGQGDLEAIAAVLRQANQRFFGIDLSQLASESFALRVAAHRFDLTDKVVAWAAGLDDRYLEVLKQLLLHELEARDDSHVFEDAQLVEVADDSLVFMLFAPDGDGDLNHEPAAPCGTRVAVPVATYQQIVGSQVLESAFAASPSVTVDAKWAKTVLQELHQGH